MLVSSTCLHHRALSTRVAKVPSHALCCLEGTRGIGKNGLLLKWHIDHVHQYQWENRRRFYSGNPHTPLYNNPNASKIFVSRHNNSLNVSANDILEYCQSTSAGLSLTKDARQTATHVILKECPFCSKPSGAKASNMYKLYVQIGGGAYFCHRCGQGGSWYDFKAQLGGYSVERGLGNGGGGRGSTSNSGTGSGSNGAGNGRTYHRTTGEQEGYAIGRGSPDNSYVPRSSGITTPCLPLPAARLSGYYSTRLLDEEGNSSGKDTASGSAGAHNSVLHYLETVRGLHKTTLRKYGVGRATYKFPSDRGGYQDAECVTFPWIMRESDVQTQEALRGSTFVLESELKSNQGAASNPNDKKQTKKQTPQTDPQAPPTVPTGTFVTRRIKVRAIEQKSWQRLDPPGGGWGLFGLHTVPDDATEIVLTEGEYDAMAVAQATGRPAVSLPNGCRSLPVQVLPLLERFEKIYLWMDNDAPGQEGAEKFAKKLGLNRCYIVHCHDAKDANEALLKGDIDLNEKLERATLVPHDRILTFQDLRDDVLHELLQPDKYSGVPVPSLPGFTKIVKGFRRGELTVLTGPTGSGKTTFLGQVSLDLAEQGINVLWGSFEIKNTRLLHKLLRQFSRDALPDSSAPNAGELLDSLADRFQALPLYFMRFHGGSEVDEVLDAMEYAVYVNDVEHIVLDNMQFMISRNVQKGSFDKFDVQDIAIEKFRKFATEHNVHLTLVVHPRKEDESSKLGISSFYGSAKATQEADTVIILQNDGKRKYIDVKKNRFDGTLGYSPLYFQSSSGRYVENEMDGDKSQKQTLAYQPTRPDTYCHDKSPPPTPLPPGGLQNHWNSVLTSTNRA